MSKSGNYNLGEIERRDELIQELCEALESMVARFGGSATCGSDMLAIKNARHYIAKVRNP